MSSAPLCWSARLLSLLFIIAAPSAGDCYKFDDLDDAVQLMQLEGKPDAAEVQQKLQPNTDERQQKMQPSTAELQQKLQPNITKLEQKLQPNTTELQQKLKPIGGTIPSWIPAHLERKLSATREFLLSTDSAVVHQARLMLDILQADRATDESLVAFNSSEHVKIADPEFYFTSTFNELTAMLGIPAFCVLPFSLIGSTGLPIRATVLLLAAQCWILQGASLYLMLEGIKAAMPADPLPRLAVALATYLNVLNHLGELPLALLLMRHVHEFHKTIHDKVLAVIICFAAGVLVPCAAIVIGGFFLSTANNYCDLFMKSVVFKFISNIDNWVVAINSRSNVVAGSVEPLMVHLPRDKDLARLLNYILCVIPVVPALIVFGLSSVSAALRYP